MGDEHFAHVSRRVDREKAVCPDRPTDVSAHLVGMLLTSAGHVEATIPNTVSRGVLIRLGRRLTHRRKLQSGPVSTVMCPSAEGSVACFGRARYSEAGVRRAVHRSYYRSQLPGLGYSAWPGLHMPA